MTEIGPLLRAAARRAAGYRARVDDLPTHPGAVDVAGMREALGTLPDGPTDAGTVIELLADTVEPALVGSTGPRYFGFVTGGALDAATAAEVLVAGYDQLAFNAVSSPAAAIVEEVAGAWLIDLLGLPPGVSFGLVTGGQGANTVALAAARHKVLADVGWDVEAGGLQGAPALRVVAGAEAHVTIGRSLRLLGLGTSVIEPVATDAQGAIDVEDLGRVLAAGAPGPTIVALQAGNVSSGAFDDFVGAIEVAQGHGAWVHVDGAFGLWAGASESTRHLVAGVERADSWGTDGHKWLNVPYDCGYVFCAHPGAHVAAMSFTASYLTGQGTGEIRIPSDFVPESSRRARGFATWAAIRELGRDGVGDLVERCCREARRFADQLRALEGVSIANDVVLNQVLVDFGDPAETDRVVEAVQRSGVCWMGAATWRGRRCMRISVSSAKTTDADVDRCVAAITQALGEVRAAPSRP